MPKQTYSLGKASLMVTVVIGVVVSLGYLLGTTSGRWLLQKHALHSDSAALTKQYFLRFAMEHDHRIYQLSSPDLRFQMDAYFATSEPQSCYEWDYTYVGGASGDGHWDYTLHCGQCVMFVTDLVVEPSSDTGGWSIKELAEVDQYCYPSD